MLYKYSPEAMERFKEVDKYMNTDIKKAVDVYLKIAEDYQHDEGVLAKAYYGAGNLYNLLSDMENSEKYCKMSIQAAKNSKNMRCQVLSLIQIAVLKLNQMNDALAADYIFDALSLAIENEDDDVMNTIYTLLAQIFETAESFDTALMYHQKGIEEFVRTYPNGDVLYASTYGARVLCKGVCCISSGKTESFEACYNELLRIHFAETMPVYRVAMIFMKGYLYYIKGNNEKAIPTLLEFIEELSKEEEIMDSYELLTHVYNLFEKCDFLEGQKKVVDLMKYYASVFNVWKCKKQCNNLEIRYYRQIDDKEALFDAYSNYYTLQQEYRSDYMKQRRANLELRKHLFDEEETIRFKINSLEELSETDALTGLANRKGLEKYKQLFDKALLEQKQVGVALIDIDKYKGYNDTYGHLQGDECLKCISKAIKETMGNHFAARYGGDEFICVFIDADKNEVFESLNRLKEYMKRISLEHKANTPFGIVTLSQGAAVRFPTKTDTFETLVADADMNLYEVKENGRNSIRINE